MFRSLSPGAIGDNVENLADGLDLAARPRAFRAGRLADAVNAIVSK